MTRSRRIPFAVGAAGAVIALVGLGLLAWKTQSVDSHTHENYDHRLRELRRLDRTLNQEVLRVRFHMVHSYDTLASLQDQIDLSVAQTEQTPPFVVSEARQELNEAISAYSTASHQKHELLEEFKGHNSILRNSLRYLPTLAARIIADNPAGEAGSIDAARVGEILQMLLIYNLTAERDHAAPIEGRIAALLANTPADAPGHSRVTLFTAHARAVLREKPIVDRIVNDFFDVPIVERETALVSSYRNAHVAATATADAYRILLCVICGLLALVVFESFRRLRRALAAVETANATLETRVELRTQELSERNRDMRLLLDNMQQGFLTVEPDGRLLSERSLIVDTWLGEHQEGEHVWEALGRADENAGAWLKLGWESLQEDFLPFEVCLEQLPASAQIGQTRLQLEYQPFDDPSRHGRMLVVLTDVTAQFEQQRANAEHSEMVNVIQSLSRDRGGFLDFFTEASRLVDQLLHEPMDATVTQRVLHTLKGNCAIYGADRVADVCHRLESSLVDEARELTPEERDEISTCWIGLTQRIQPLVGQVDERSVEVPLTELESLLSDIREGESRDALVRRLTLLTTEPLTRQLERLGQHIARMAERLGKPVPVIAIEALDIRVPAGEWSEFSAGLVHVVRNAVDHGLEMPEERRQQGKPERGSIRLEVALDKDDLLLRLADDGRGIDWDRVLEKARKLGVELPPEQDAARLHALFADGVSTRNEVTTVSGRGVGMSAVREACAQLGGTVEVRSDGITGTEVVFRFSGMRGLFLPGATKDSDRRSSLPARDQVHGHA